MKRTTFSLTVLLLSALAFSAAGQAYRGSYFFENSLQRSRMNAAFAPDRNYVVIPALGGVAAEARSNVGLENFVFPITSKNYLFLNEKIDAETFLGKLPSEGTSLHGSASVELGGVGMKIGRNGFLTAGLSLQADAGAAVPNELFRMAKYGRTSTQRAYKIADLEVAGQSRADLSLGYSYDLGDRVEGLRVGGRVHLLFGLQAARVQVDRLDVSLDDDEVAAYVQGTGLLSGFHYTDGVFGLDPLRIKGFGATVDLGAEYRLRFDGFIDGLNLSASVNNLGGLSYGANKLSLDNSFSFKGIQDIDLNGDLDLGEQVDRVVEELRGLMDLREAGEDRLPGKLTPRIFAGAEVPFLHEMMSVGLLYYNVDKASYLMASLNVTPLEWLDFGLNYTFLGPAKTWGFYAEFIPRRYVSAFVGMDMRSFESLRTNGSHIPIHPFATSFCLGLSYLF